MKAIFRKLFPTLLLLPLTALAGPVDEATARQQAQAFLQQRGIAKADAPLKATVRSRRAPSVTGTTTPSYYVFNIGTTEGFVIVSGDDRTTAILGYADSGTIDEEALPDGLRYLLNGYAEQIAWLEENEGSEGSSEPHNTYKTYKAHTARTPVAPLIPTRWNQGAPYNTYCPTISDERTVTGCVATTLAQLMYYHQWPVSEINAIDGYTFNSKNKAKADTTLTFAPLPATTFKWTDMTLSYANNATGDASDAVAELMRYCGSALQMRYGLSANGGSSSYSENIPYALTSCFGYDGGVHHAYRKNYSYTDWVDLIYSELADRRPVALGGQSTGGGHSFVCDGYDTDDLFHINWGWGGKSNGYFRLSLLNPYEQGIGGSSTLDGFSFSQDAVIGIQPPVDGNKDYCLSLEGLHLGSPDQAHTSKTYTRDGETGSFTGISLYVQLYSYMQGSHAFDYAVQLVDANGDVVCELYADENKTLGWNGHVDGTLTNIILPSTVADGTYYIKVASRLNGTDVWQECFDGDAYQLTAIISDDCLTINVPITSTVLPSEATIVVEGNLTQGYEQQVTASITGGAVDYHGNIVLGVNGDAVMGKVLDIPAGITVDAHFTFIPTTAGNNTLSLYTNRDGYGKVSGSHIGSDATVTIIGSDAANTQAITVEPVIANLDNTTGKLFGNALRVTATVGNPSTENSYASQLNCSLRTYDSAQAEVDDYTSATVQNKIITIGKNSTTDVTFEYTGLELGKFYCLRFTYTQSYDDNGTTKSHTQEALITDRYEMGEGYLAYNADGTTTIKPTDTEIDSGTSLCLDLTSLSTIPTVNPSSNPNCLYLLNGDACVPASLDGCNVVCGGVADHLTLTDGYDFYTPVAFTATNASYTRTFTLAANGTNGWNTLFLPFTATTVTCEGLGTVDWFHSASDSGKNFWLRLFTADGEGSVTFDYANADHIAANTPYIIAVPDDRFGAEWQMTGKTVTFSGTGVSVDVTRTAGISGNHYNSCGSTTAQTLADVYLLNASGSRFVKATTATAVPAFRTWFAPASISSLSRSTLTISSPDETGIEMIEDGKKKMDGFIYDMQGRKVNGQSSMVNRQSSMVNGQLKKKGLYITNGHKIVIK